MPVHIYGLSASPRWLPLDLVAMYGFYQDGTYSASQIKRNRIFILVPSCLAIAVGLTLLALGIYEFSNFGALLVLVGFFSSGMWWAMASKSSGPVKIDPNTVDFFKRLVKPRSNDQ